MNSMILHEIFFASLGERGEPEGALRDALIHNFGSVSTWAAEFSAMGKAQRGGSGWVLLTWSPRDCRLVNQWAMDHSTTLAGGQPITRARYVRALLSHRLWCPGGCLCRCFHGGDQLAGRRRRLCRAHASRVTVS